MILIETEDGVRYLINPDAVAHARELEEYRTQLTFRGGKSLVVEEALDEVGRAFGEHRQGSSGTLVGEAWNGLVTDLTEAPDPLEGAPDPLEEELDEQEQADLAAQERRRLEIQLEGTGQAEALAAGLVQAPEAARYLQERTGIRITDNDVARWRNGNAKKLPGTLPHIRVGLRRFYFRPEDLEHVAQQINEGTLKI